MKSCSSRIWHHRPMVRDDQKWKVLIRHPHLTFVHAPMVPHGLTHTYTCLLSLALEMHTIDHSYAFRQARPLDVSTSRFEFEFECSDKSQMRYRCSHTAVLMHRMCTRCCTFLHLSCLCRVLYASCPIAIRFIPLSVRFAF